MTEKEEIWRIRLAAWRASGLNRGEFCKREGLNVSTLDYWQYRARANSTPQRRSAKAPARLIPVEVAAAVEPRYEIRVGNARSLVISGTFVARAVRELIQVLEAPP